MRSFRIVLSLLALTLAGGVFSYAAGNQADACYYKYDKVGRLVGVEYANAPERNEFYSYDNRGNILEKRIGAKTYTYSYDASNQLKSMASEDGVREYIYDEAGRLVEEKLNGETEVEYRYGYLDKVTEVIRNGKSVKYAYDGFGMLTEKRFEDGTIEKWVWDGIALVRRGSDIYVNEPHVSGGVPILTKTAEGVRYHENDYLGTTLWSTDTKGNLLSNYSESTVFGEGNLQASRSARFTGKPYDEDMHAYVFPFRNYNPAVARWISSDPSGYPDGINQHFYACHPLLSIDPLGLLDKGTLHKTNNTIFGRHPSDNREDGGTYFDVYTIKTNDGKETITLYKNIYEGSPSGYNEGYNQNCHGYTFASDLGNYWISNDQVGKILQGDGYTVGDDGIATAPDGSKVVLWGDEHSGKLVEGKDGQPMVDAMKGLNTKPEVNPLDKAWNNGEKPHYEK